MKRPDDVPGADWTSAGGFPLLRHIARRASAPAAGERPRRGHLIELAGALLRRLAGEPAAPVPGLAAADLARPAGASCSRCGRRYFPRPTGARPAEDGRCRPCALATAEHAVVQISARRRAR